MNPSMIAQYRNEKKWEKFLGKPVEVLQVFEIQGRRIALIMVKNETLLVPIHSEVGDLKSVHLSLAPRARTKSGAWIHGLILAS